jgi:hypothetical protein
MTVPHLYRHECMFSMEAEIKYGLSRREKMMKNQPIMAVPYLLVRTREKKRKKEKKKKRRTKFAKVFITSPVPKFIDSLFAKTSSKRSFSCTSTTSLWTYFLQWYCRYKAYDIFVRCESGIHSKAQSLISQSCPLPSAGEVSSKVINGSLI